MSLGNLNIGTDHRMRMLSFFYGDDAGGSAFKPDSFFDVATGTLIERVRINLALCIWYLLGCSYIKTRKTKTKTA